MELTIGGKKYEIKYTFNSFKYMEDLDMGVMQEIDKKPFKLVGVLSTLLCGAMNHDRKKKVYTTDDCEDLIAKYVEDGGSLGDLFTDLTSLLESSGFFKSLQK